MLRALTDGTNEIVYVVDPETYKILFANKKTKEVFGENVTGKKCHKAFYKLNKPCLFCPCKHVFGKNLRKTHIDEFQNPRTKRWYRCIDNPIKWSNGKYVLFEIAIDITEQKRMEESLRESEGRYRKIIETVPEVIYIVSAEGTIKSLNPAFEKITGWSSEEWNGKSFVQIVHPDDLPLAAEMFQKVLDGETSPLYRLRIRSKSGEYIVGEFQSIPIIESGKVVAEFGVVNDITERKRMEEALQESEELFRSVVENSHNGIAILDDNFRVIYINDEIERLTGYSRNEVIGQDFRKFRKFLDKECPQLLDIYLRRQNGESVPSNYKFGATRKDGQKRDFDVKSTLFRDRHGIARTIVQIIDVTDRKRMEEERKNFEKRLSALNTYGQSLNKAKSMKGIYRLTLDAAEKTLGFEYASILMVEGKKLCLVANRGYSKTFSLEIPLDGKKGITVRVANTGKPVFVSDIRKDKRYIRGGEGIRSELAVPIKSGNKILGVLNIESKKLSAFDEEDRKLLEILASHASIAITNLSRQKRLSALNDYGKSSNMAENFNEIYTLTLNAMEKILGFEFATFFIVEEKKLRLTAHRGYPEKLDVAFSLKEDKGISVKAAKTGKPIFVPDIRMEKAYVPGRLGMLCELAVPIKAGKDVLGVLNVESERLDAFDKNDSDLLEILASHAAAAMSNLNRREMFKTLSEKLTNLMESSTRIMQVKDTRQRLEVIAKAIQNFGWRRVVISLRDENMEGTNLVTAGLTKKEMTLLLERKAPGNVWKERLGPKFERYKIGEFYYIPWSDRWIRENFHGVPHGASPDEATTYAGVPSRLSEEEMVDWHPQDMIYAPLHTPEGRIVGILSMDDPMDGRKPSTESIAPLELFLHQAAITIENAQLIESLSDARKQLETYAEQLEHKVEERTRELQQSQEQLLKAQRLAVIGELAGMVGHDLRNPLTSIAGAEYYLKKRLGSRAGSNINEMLQLMEKNIAYSNKIINDLLEYSREMKLDLVESSPKAVIREALSFVEIPKRIRLINLAKNKPKMKIDIGKIKRALINIINNAIEAMPKGGTLTIKSEKKNNNVVFGFSDTGIGISKKTLENLWTPLFTTKARGMGFGLPICKRIIEAHDGTISVESAYRKGTTFTVTIPIDQKIEEGGERSWVTALESLLLTTTKTSERC